MQREREIEGQRVCFRKKLSVSAWAKTDSMEWPHPQSCLPKQFRLPCQCNTHAPGRAVSTHCGPGASTNMLLSSLCLQSCGSGTSGLSMQHLWSCPDEISSLYCRCINVSAELRERHKREAEQAAAEAAADRATLAAAAASEATKLKAVRSFWWLEFLRLAGCPVGVCPALLVDVPAAVCMCSTSA